MWFLAVILNFLVAILRFLATIIKIKRSTGVQSDSIGFLDPENMGIDIRIVLLGAAITKLWWFYVIFSGHFEFFGGLFELFSSHLGNEKVFCCCKWFCWIPWPWKHGIDIRMALLGASITKLWLFFVIFGGHFEFFGGYFELFGSHLGN